MAPLPQLAARLRLKQASKMLSASPPDKVVSGVGCEVVQHLLDYTWPGANATNMKLSARMLAAGERVR